MTSVEHVAVSDAAVKEHHLNAYGMRCPWSEKALHFLAEQGLPVKVVPGAKGFIRHVRVVDGGLHVDPRATVSGILHEAGHLAVLPGQYRHLFSDDLDAGQQLMELELARIQPEPDSPLLRAAMQSSDTEATAWAFACGRHLGVPDDLIILNSEYVRTGATIRMQLQASAYLGINGLCHAGFCVRRATPYRPLPVYPQLAFWLQPVLSPVHEPYTSPVSNV